MADKLGTMSQKGREKERERERRLSVSERLQKQREKKIQSFGSRKKTAKGLSKAEGKTTKELRCCVD